VIGNVIVEALADIADVPLDLGLLFFDAVYGVAKGGPAVAVQLRGDAV
jgi:hypothetical protein